MKHLLKQDELIRTSRESSEDISALIRTVVSLKAENELWKSKCFILYKATEELLAFVDAIPSQRQSK